MVWVEILKRTVGEEILRIRSALQQLWIPSWHSLLGVPLRMTIKGIPTAG